MAALLRQKSIIFFENPEEIICERWDYVVYETLPLIWATSLWIQLRSNFTDEVLPFWKTAALLVLRTEILKEIGLA